jgi:hypothetical protein
MSPDLIKRGEGDSGLIPGPRSTTGFALEAYDAGLLNGFGGGDVGWWQDYIRAELGRAHDFYQAQVDSASVAATEATTRPVAELDRQGDVGLCVGGYPISAEACPECGATDRDECRRPPLPELSLTAAPAVPPEGDGKAEQ